MPSALFVALRPLFPSQQAQYAQVFRVQSAPFCTLFASLGSTNKSATSLLFSFCLTLVLSSPPCPLLHLSVLLKLSGRKYLLSPAVLSGYNASAVSGNSGNDAADELARRGALLAPSAIPCSLSRLISRIRFYLFSDWRRTVSSKLFDTQVSSIATEELVLPRHARCVLSRLRCYAVRLRCNGHSLLLGSYLSRIGRIENPSCSTCGHWSQDTFHLILHCPATDCLRRSLFGDSLSLYDRWFRPRGVARLLGPHGLLPCPHSLGRDRAININNNMNSKLKDLIFITVVCKCMSVNWMSSQILLLEIPSKWSNQRIGCKCIGCFNCEQVQLLSRPISNYSSKILTVCNLLSSRFTAM